MKLFSGIFILLLCGLVQVCQAQILIFTTAYNRPDFIEMQHKTFKKFLKNEYEFKVFNDADNAATEQEIKNVCARCGIECIRVPQNFHGDESTHHGARASFRHGESVQYAFEHSGFKHDDIVVLLDSDEFLLHDWDIRAFLGDADVYVLHGHMKPQLTIVNMPQLPDRDMLNFRAGFANGEFSDAGAFTRFYLQEHPDLKRKQGTMFWGLYRGFPTDVGIDRNGDVGAYLRPMGYTPVEIQFIKRIVDLAKATNNFSDADVGFYETNLFLDFKHGSDWHGPNMTVRRQKDQIVKSFIESLV